MKKEKEKIHRALTTQRTNAKWMLPFEKSKNDNSERVWCEEVELVVKKNGRFGGMLTEF